MMAPGPQFADQSDKQPRLGVALGGGSARGYAHIGVLKILEQHDLRPDLIVGTSFGAVVASLYCLGHSVTDLQAQAAEMRRSTLLPRLLDFGLHRASLFEGRRLEAYLEEITGGKTFADLETPLAVAATDVDTGELVLLREGSLARALRASVAMPGVFCPIEIDGRRLVDGGLAAPSPLATLEGFDVDVRIGIGAGMTEGDSPVIGVTRRLVQTRHGRRRHRRMAASKRQNAVARLLKAAALTVDSWNAGPVRDDELHLHTRPPISWLNFSKAGAAIEAGEAAMASFMPRLRTAITKVSGAG